MRLLKKDISVIFIYFYLQQKLQIYMLLTTLTTVQVFKNTLHPRVALVTQKSAAHKWY